MSFFLPLKRLVPTAFQMGYERKVIQIYYIRRRDKKETL